jgi:AcrR family transcriptional regulator
MSVLLKQKPPVVLYRTVRSEKTRREVLDVAVDLASAEGLEALTIGRLAEAVEMSKSGLFAHFGSKEGLQLATVDRARDIFVDKVIQPSLAAAPGTACLAAMLDSWLSYVESIVFRGGCFFAAVSAEFDSRPGAVRDKIAKLTKTWITALEEEARRAQALKQLSESVDVGQLVFELHAYVQEANWAFKLFDDADAFMRARAAIASRIAASRTASIKNKRETERQSK